MATADDVIALEESHQGDDGSAYNEWYWGDDNGWAWCDAFQQKCFADSGVSDLLCTRSAYCPTQMNAMRNAGLEIDGPQRGAIVFFDWDNDGEVDHIGLVRWDNGDGTFCTVEGNSNDSVRCMTQGVNWGYSCYFFMPQYDGAQPDPQPEPEPTEQAPSGDHPQDGTTGSGVTYEAFTEDGWQGECDHVDNSQDGFAGADRKAIYAIRAYRQDGQHVSITPTLTDGTVLDTTTFTGSMQGDNPQGDGVAGNADANSSPIATLHVEGCRTRVSADGASWMDWEEADGSTPQGDACAGGAGEPIVCVQMMA